MDTAAYRKVTAIVRIEMLERVEKALQEIHVGGVTVTRVKGYGEYVDLYTRDWMTQYARLEIFTGAARADRIVECILAAASTGGRGDGIVSVLPVERVWRVRARSLADPDAL